MIISASYKTDIPTFYGEWFMNRLRASYCKVINPYNKRVSNVSLSKKDVDGFVFWTKNVGPFIKYFEEIQEMGFPFVLQHTINGYPRALERSVVDSSKSVEYMRQVADRYGPRTAVWRYDTIINSSLTPREFHLDTFSKLANSLHGVTDEVVVSFAHIYAKTQRNMEQAASENNFTWSDLPDKWKQELIKELAVIAKSHNIQLSVCSQEKFIMPGCVNAHCIDADRLTDVAEKTIQAKLKGNRQECGCFESRDIGEYDACPHGCIYCYAVQNQELAKSRYQQHDPLGESLYPLPPDAIENTKQNNQLNLL